MFTAVLMIVAGPAFANGKDTAPGQEKKVDSSEEETSDESEDPTEDEASEEEVAEEAEETSELEDESDEEEGTKWSGDRVFTSDDSQQRTTSSSTSNAVETAEDCPNEKNREGEFTGNGANTSGSYDSTCDGRESENGNGNGGASGRPCMGCVGNADNKNPPGQFPDGSDANNGYECDGNNGVGKGNPAHTDCPEERGRPPKPPTCPDGRPMPPSGICDVPVQRPPLPDVIKRPGLPPDRVKPRRPFANPPAIPRFVPKRRVSGVLPVTGPKDLLPYVWFGLSLMAAGMAALATARRRRELQAHQR